MQDILAHFSSHLCLRNMMQLVLAYFGDVNLMSLCSSSGNHNVRPQLAPSGIVRGSPEIERNWRNWLASKQYVGQKIALFFINLLVDLMCVC